MDASAFQLLIVPAGQGVALGLGFGLVIHLALEWVAPRQAASSSDDELTQLSLSPPASARANADAHVPDDLARFSLTTPRADATTPTDFSRWM